MSRRARIRAAAAAAVALAIGLLFATGIVQGVYASFSAETENPGSAFAGGWIPAPTVISASISGSTTASFSWTSGASATMPAPNPNPVTGQQLSLADGGSSGSAACGTYNTLPTSLTLSSTSATDSSGTLGHWWCYRVTSTSGTTWTTSANFPALLALVPTSLATSGTGGSSSLQIDNGDTISIGYNQAVSGSGTVTVCAFKTVGVILIGDSGCASSGDTPTIGKITGLSIPNANRTFASSTWSASGSTVTIVIGGGASGATGRTSVTGTGTYTGAGSAVAASGNGGGTQCTVASTCTPSATVSF